MLYQDRFFLPNEGLDVSSSLRKGTDPMNRQLILDYPAKLPDAMNETPAEFEKEARMAMAAKLFEMKRIPSGVAAAFAGMDRVSFLLKLKDYNVAAIALDEEELAEDVANA
jgi:predicted HTH domain antitoxin